MTFSWTSWCGSVGGGEEGAGGGALPDEVVDAAGKRVGFFFGEGRAREEGVEIVQNEHLHVGLGLGVLRPVGHGPEMGYERGEQALAGALEAFAVRLANGVFE